MKKILTIFFILSFTNVKSQTPDWLWARQGNNNGNTMTGTGEGLSVATDLQGNVYFCGGYSSIDSLSFGSYLFTNPNSGGTFLIKYSPAGNVLWAKSSNNEIAFGYSLATDLNGNVYMAGTFTDSIITFGSFTLTHDGYNAANLSYTPFLVKYDSNGNVIWAKGPRGIGSDIWASSVATDNIGNVFITGFFNSPTLNFGTTTLFNNGSSTVFTAKYNSSGNLLWAKSAIDSLINAYGSGIATDPYGNAYITGSFRSPSVTFGSITLFNTDTVQYYPDLFLVKYDPNGNVIWAKREGSTGAEQTNGICTNSKGKIFVTGFFSDYGGRPPFIIGTDTLIASPPNAENTFVIELDTSGNPLWAKQSRGARAQGHCVISDSLGNTYFSGGKYSISPSDTIIFDAISIILPSGQDAAFIVKYDSLGNVIWVKPMEGGGDDQSSMAFGINGDIFFGGDFYQINPFILGSDTLILNGIEAPFVAKLGFNILPIKLLSFNVNSNKDKIQLHWRTAQESNNLGFEIYRSEGNTSVFKKIAFMPGAGYSSTEKNYYFTDNYIRKGVDYYYRLKQLDLDNNFTYSSIQKGKVNDDGNLSIVISPNPVTDALNVYVNGFARENFTVSLIYISGKAISTKTYTNNSTDASINIDIKNLPAGVYIFKLMQSNKLITEKVIKR